jgi:dTDP-4-dehydrorhamnose 3,5-epimerase
MMFNETPIAGTYTIELEKRGDERGFFARTWCQQEFAKRGLHTSFVQANLSFNKKRGTLRGLHYQTEPHQEAKLIRCTRGGIYDVVLDVRNGSPTFGRWISVELSHDNYRLLFIPGGCATGYQTLADDTEVAYQVSEFYTPSAERGIRYNDRTFAIKWPIEPTIISEKDLSWADYKK